MTSTPSADFLPEDEEQDEPSSSLTQPPSVEDVLTSFREKWQRELQITKKIEQEPVPETEIDYEMRAKMYFLNGVEMEKSGKLYEAIQFYKRAVQLVPDIEFRVHNTANPKILKEHNVFNEQEPEELSSNESDEGDDDGELLQRIQKKSLKFTTLCGPKIEQKGTHISALPMEMLLYILRWVVSSELDLRSLEMFSMVCRGFYLCARDQEVWRLACLRVWGLNCGNFHYDYLSWRHMFIERARLQFNGCYIGKTAYIRHGENSFQDQFYRPWHLVTYYRYLRFFPEGVVLLLTSSEVPAQCVTQMKGRNARSPILRGYYRLKDDKVTLVIHRQNMNLLEKNKRRVEELSNEQTFHMELQIKNTNKKRHVQLVWTHYSISTKTNRGESTFNFDLLSSKFPPLWFSRVKSYTSESETPLN